LQSQRRSHIVKAVKFPSLLVSLVPIACLLAACEKPPAPAKPPTTTPIPTPVPEPDDPLAIRMGVFLPLTGNQATFGQTALNGAALAVAQINAAGGVLGHPIRLIVRDTRSEAGISAGEVRDLITRERVSALIGEMTSDRSMEAAPVAGELRIPMVSPASTHSDLTKDSPWVFRVCFVDTFQGKVMSKFARSIGVTRAAILSDEASAYSTGLAEAFEKDFTAQPGAVVIRESYPHGTTDFTAQLKALVEKKPEVIFLPAYYVEAAAIIRQARPLGLDIPFIGTDGWESPDFLKAGGDAVGNSYFATHFSTGEKSARTTGFTNAYREKFQSEPSALSALAYDAVGFVADAIVRAGTTDAEPLRAAMAGTTSYPGVTGDIDLDAERNPSKPAIVIRVEEGKFTYLETVKP